MVLAWRDLAVDCQSGSYSREWVIGTTIGDRILKDYIDYYRDPVPHSLLSTRQLSRQATAQNSTNLGYPYNYAFGHARLCNIPKRWKSQ